MDTRAAHVGQRKGGGFARTRREVRLFLGNADGVPGEEGQEFSLKPHEQIKYKLVDVQPAKAVIVNTQNQRNRSTSVCSRNDFHLLYKMMKTLRIASLVVCGMISVSFAQDVHSIAEREVMRRQQGIGHGEATLIQAKAAMDVKIMSAHTTHIAPRVVFCLMARPRITRTPKRSVVFARAE